jgi:hypothetical protein
MNHALYNEVRDIAVQFPITLLTRGSTMSAPEVPLFLWQTQSPTYRGKPRIRRLDDGRYSLDMTDSEQSPIGCMLYYIHYGNTTLYKLAPDPTGAPHDGGEHKLRIRGRIEDLIAYLEIIVECFVGDRFIDGRAEMMTWHADLKRISEPLKFTVMKKRAARPESGAYTFDLARAADTLLGIEQPDAPVEGFRLIDNSRGTDVIMTQKKPYKMTLSDNGLQLCTESLEPTNPTMKE